jgi:hypothetical protein
MWQLGLLNMGRTNPMTVPTKWIGYRISWGTSSPSQGLFIGGFPREFDAIDLMNRRNKVDACDEMGGMEGAVSTMIWRQWILVMPPCRSGFISWDLSGLSRYRCKKLALLMPNVTRDGERALVVS